MNNKNILLPDTSATELYGYVLNDCILIDIENNRAVKIYYNDFYSCRIVKLNSSTMTLLVYLLNNVESCYIARDDIMDYLYRKNKCNSSQRLWQLLKEVKLKMLHLGITSFITPSKKGSYSVKKINVRKLLIE